MKRTAIALLRLAYLLPLVFLYKALKAGEKLTKSASAAKKYGHERRAVSRNTN